MTAFDPWRTFGCPGDAPEARTIFAACGVGELCDVDGIARGWLTEDAMFVRVLSARLVQKADEERQDN